MNAEVAIWIGLAVGVSGLQFAALLSRHRIPTFGDAATWAMRRRPARVILLVGWVWIGWHVFVRSQPG